MTNLKRLCQLLLVASLTQGPVALCAAPPAAKPIPPSIEVPIPPEAATVIEAVRSAAIRRDTKELVRLYSKDILWEGGAKRMFEQLGEGEDYYKRFLNPLLESLRAGCKGRRSGPILAVDCGTSRDGPTSWFTLTDEGWRLSHLSP
jgi:hypothetical protein